MQFAVEMAITLMGIDCELVVDRLPDFVFLVFLRFVSIITLCC